METSWKKAGGRPVSRRGFQKSYQTKQKVVCQEKNKRTNKRKRKLNHALLQDALGEKSKNIERNTAST